MANHFGRHTTWGQHVPVRKFLNAYIDGDVNHPEDLRKWRCGDDGWTQTAPVPDPNDYVTYVKTLVPKWPHLELLSDFMDAGTAPMRWNPKFPGGYPDDRTEKQKQRLERMARTNVTILDYADAGQPPTPYSCTSSKGLKKRIQELETEDSKDTKFRLIVSEDLSREVIEILGSTYDVDPSFFREHLSDNIWYNLKDWWRDPPNLDIVARGQNWFQMRFSRPRWFNDQEAYKRGSTEVDHFNVFRQLQGDFSHSGLWDTDKDANGEKDTKIGHIRTRATFWIQDSTLKQRPQPHRQGAPEPRKPVVAILLLDPTIKEGHPLWRLYRNWNRVPSLSEVASIPPGPPPVNKNSFFDYFIYWASRPGPSDFGSMHGHQGSHSPICIPLQALMHIICNEWLTVVDYIKTRLNQVDWEIAFPSQFLTKDEQIEKALGKLHYWRRVVPVYRAMLADTFLRVFREAKHPDRMNPERHAAMMNMHAEGTIVPEVNGHVQGHEMRARFDMSTAPSPASHMHETGPAPSTQTKTAGHTSALDSILDLDCIKAYRHDYTLILNYMEEYQTRIDRLTGVVTAVISIQDSRRGYKDNKNLQWLTWLATLFIPLSFVATMLSMTTDPLYQLQDAAILWAEVSIPSGLLIMSFVLLISIAQCRRAVRAFFAGFPWFGKWLPFTQKSHSQ